jgi:hypothetical protein
LVKGRTDCNFSVMVWGCICYNGVGTLTKVEGNINANKYISILEDNIWPVIVRHFPGNDYLFQDDNAPVHRARSTKEYLARTHLKNMSWPAQSSDPDIVLQNADVFVSIYIPFHLRKCSYAVIANTSPHHNTEIAVSSPLHQVRSPPFSTFPPYIYMLVLPNTNL